MKRVILCAAFVLLLLCAGCASANKPEAEKEAEQIEVRMSQNYTEGFQKKGLRPAGVTVWNGFVVVSCAEDNCLALLDESGNVVRKIGSLGNGAEEWLHPTGLAADAQKLYAVDSGNQRIKVLDGEFCCIETLPLQKLENTAEVYYTDLSAAEDGTLYAATNSAALEKARLYAINADGTVRASKEPFYGYSDYADGKLLCANTFSLSEMGGSFYAKAGDSALYQMDHEGTQQVIAALPYKYTPTDFVAEGEELYILSCGWARLDRFKTDGTYVETIWKFDRLSPESYLARTEHGFLISDYQNDVLYYVRENES